MRIGVPKEIKNHEYRVGLTPASVRELVPHGHQVLVQTGAGAGHRPGRRAYARPARRSIADVPRRSSPQAEMIVKVKEPQPDERSDAAPGPDPLHLSAPGARSGADPRLVKSGAVCIAYETVTDAGGLPLLTPMSEVAGRMRSRRAPRTSRRPRAAAACCWAACRACRRRKSSSSAAAWSAPTRRRWPSGMGARRDRLDRASSACASSDLAFGNRSDAVTRPARASKTRCVEADLVIGARAGAGRGRAEAGDARHAAPMKPGSVIVDVAIDQGGCFETSRADHARGADLRRRRRRALLRGQHARRGRAHLHLRAQQRHAAATAWRSRTRAGRRRSATTRTCATASTCAKATSPTKPWRRTWVTSTCPRSGFLPD